MKKILILIVLSISIFFYQIAPGYSADLYVDPLHPRYNSTHATLSAALQDANNGDTIYLRNEILDQSYDFGGPYTINKAVTIRMDYWYCPPTALPILNGGGGADSVVTIASSNVILRELQIKNVDTLDNRGNGTLISINIGVTNTQIKNCLLDNTAGNGINAFLADTLTLSGNTFYGIGGDAVYLSKCTNVVIKSGIIGLEDSVDEDRSILGNGIVLRGCTDNEISDNFIFYCEGNLGAIAVGKEGAVKSRGLQIWRNYIAFNLTANGIFIDDVESKNDVVPNKIFHNTIVKNVYTPIDKCTVGSEEVYHGNSITLYKPAGRIMVKHNTIAQNLCDVSLYSCATDPTSCGHPGSGIYIYKNTDISPEPEVFVKNNIICMYKNPDDTWRCWEPPSGCSGCCYAIATCDIGEGQSNETYADYNFIGGPENIQISWSVVVHSPFVKFLLSKIIPFLDIGGDNWSLVCDFPDPEDDPEDGGDDGHDCGAMEVECNLHLGFLRQRFIDDMDVSMDYSQFDPATKILTQKFTITNLVTDDVTGDPVTMYSPQIVVPFMWYYNGIPNPFWILLGNYSFADPLPYNGGGNFMDFPFHVRAKNSVANDFNWHEYFELTDPFCTNQGYHNLEQQCTAAGVLYPWWGLDSGDNKLLYGDSASFTQQFFVFNWEQDMDFWMMNFNYIAYQTQPVEVVWNWMFDAQDQAWPGGAWTKCDGTQNEPGSEFMEIPNPDDADNITRTASSGNLNTGAGDPPFGDIISNDARYLEISTYDLDGEPTGEGINTTLDLFGHPDSYAKLQARVGLVGGGEEVFTLFDTTFFEDPDNPGTGSIPNRLRFNAVPYPFNWWQYENRTHPDYFDSQNFMTFDLFRIICEGLYEGKRVNKEDIQDLSLEFVVHRTTGDTTTKLCIDELKVSDSTVNKMKIEPMLIAPANMTVFTGPTPPEDSVPVTFRWKAYPDENYNPDDYPWFDEVYYHLALEKMESNWTRPSFVIYTKYVNVSEGYTFGTEEKVTLNLPGSTSWRWKIIALDNHGFGDATPSKQFTIEGATLIELSSFKAIPGNEEVTLQWHTESETDNAGFNIYKSRNKNGTYVKINTSLIPAKGSPMAGTTYTYVDKDVRNGLVYYYRLEDIDTSGSATLQDSTVKARPLKIHGLQFMKR